MKLQKNPVPWLVLALVALLLGFAGTDLRLFSAALCAMAALTASRGSRDAPTKEP